MSESDRANVPAPDAETQLDIYRRMMRVFLNDAAIIKTMKAGRLRMPYYSARGQEVIPSAISTCLNKDDQICTIYRGIHDMVAKDMPLMPLWAEIAGRVDGTCKGKGGPMHLTHPETGVMVTTGVVGSSMPIVNGLGWAAQLDGSKKVAIAYFGDGATNIGAFHESLNLAALWDLPVVFVCQNNQFAEHTAFKNHTKVEKLSTRAAGYNMPGVTVNGNDPFEMYAAAYEAINRAREGEGPTFIEAMTFRYNGHVFGDADAYMDKEDKKRRMETEDPVPLYKAKLLESGVATEEQLQKMEDEISAEIADAIETALASPFPDPAEIRRDVFETEIV